MKIKDRVEDFRGLKCLWSAPFLILGLIIQHNFIKPHATIKKVPCKFAGVNLGLCEDGWLELIELSHRN